MNKKYMDNYLQNNRNGLNKLFTQTESSNYVYILHLYGKDEDIDRLNEYIKNNTIIGGITGNGFNRTYIFTSKTPITIIKEVIKTYKVEYLLYEINESLYCGRGGKFVEGAIDALKNVNKK